MANRTKLTTNKKVKFCELLIETGGNVSAAARAMGLSREGCYRYKREDDPLYDPDFVAMWDAAVHEGTENLEQEAYRRSLVGTEEPHFWKDKQAGYIRRYSDTLTKFLLMARNPGKYNPVQRQELSGPDGNPIQTEEVSRARDSLERLVARRFTVTRSAEVDGGADRDSS